MSAKSLLAIPNIQFSYSKRNLHKLKLLLVLRYYEKKRLGFFDSVVVINVNI